MLCDFGTVYVRGTQPPTSIPLIRRCTNHIIMANVTAWFFDHRMDTQLYSYLLISMAAVGFFIVEDASATGHYQYYDITIAPHNSTLTSYSVNNLVEFTFTLTNNDDFTIRHDNLDSFRLWLLGENSNYKDISTQEVVSNGGYVTAGACTANAPKPIPPGEEVVLTACFWVPSSHEFNSLGVYEVTRAKGQVLPFHIDATECTSRDPICNRSQIINIPTNFGQAVDYDICNGSIGHGTFAIGGANAVDIVTVSGHTYALISSRSHHALQIIDVTDPTNPHPVITLCDDQGGFDSLKLPVGIDTATIFESTYILAGSWGDNAIQIIDITNPLDPRPITSILDDHNGFDALGGVDEITIATIEENYYAVIASNSDRAIQIVDITNPATPVPIASVFYEQSYVPSDVDLAAISGQTYVVVTNIYGAIQIVDITNPATPIPVANVFDGQHGSSLRGSFNTDIITISESTYAVVASRSDNAIQIINITNPLDPRPIASVFDGQGGFDALSSPYDVETVTISESTYAVVASRSDNAIQIINITNPLDPRPIASVFDGQGGFDALTMAHNLEVFEIYGHTYIIVSSDADSVQIIDITNPNSPVPAASIFDDVQPIVDSDSPSSTTTIFDDVQPIVDSDSPSLAAELALLYAHYNNNAGTLTLVFDQPVVVHDPSPITLIPDTGAFLDDYTAINLSGVKIETLGNKDQSYVLAFTLPNTQRLFVSELLSPHGSMILVINHSAIYTAKDLVDITKTNGDAPLFITNIVVVR